MTTSSAHRVLHVIPSPVWGGPHNEIAILKEPLERLGFESLALVPDEDGSGGGRLAEAGVQVRSLTMHRLRKVRSPLFWLGYPWRFVADVRGLLRVIRTYDVDIVEGCTVNLQGAVAGRIAGVPVVWRLIDLTAPKPIRWLTAVLLRWLADAVLVNGQALLQGYPGIRALGTRVVVYYPPVDATVFSPRERSRDVDPRPFIVGTVANLNPDKGIGDFVNAAALVRSSPVRFVVVGAEHPTHRGYAASLRGLVAELRLGDKFEFLGERMDVPALMHEFDVFVVSSVREGTTTTILEAMACGIPVVATRVGGIPELVSDGFTGVLVPPRQPLAMAAAIDGLLEAPELRKRLAAHGRAAVVERFGLERTAEAYARALGCAVARHGSRMSRRRSGPTRDV